MLRLLFPWRKSNRVFPLELETPSAPSPHEPEAPCVPSNLVLPYEPSEEFPYEPETPSAPLAAMLPSAPPSGPSVSVTPLGNNGVYVEFGHADELANAKAQNQALVATKARLVSQLAKAEALAAEEADLMAMLKMARSNKGGKRWYYNVDGPEYFWKLCSSREDLINQRSSLVYQVERKEKDLSALRRRIEELKKRKEHLEWVQRYGEPERLLYLRW